MDRPLVSELFRQEQKLGSYVGTGEALKASKCEAHPKMRPLTSQEGKTPGRPPG